MLRPCAIATVGMTTSSDGLTNTAMITGATWVRINIENILEQVRGQETLAAFQRAYGRPGHQRHRKKARDPRKRTGDLGFQGVGNRENVLKQIAANEIEEGRFRRGRSKN